MAEAKHNGQKIALLSNVNMDFVIRTLQKCKIEYE